MPRSAAEVSPARRGTKARRPWIDTMCGMPLRTHIAPFVKRRCASGPGAAAPVVGVLVLVAVALLMLLDDARVQNQQELENVAFGMPLNWVTQDQGLDPQLPHTTHFVSPWEHPTTSDWLPLVLNLAVIGLVVSGGWCGVQMVRATRCATPGGARRTV